MWLLGRSYLLARECYFHKVRGRMADYWYCYRTYQRGTISFSDYTGTPASLDAAAVIVKKVAAALKADVKEVMEGIAKVRGMVERL
jgi:hypothetical protein